MLQELECKFNLQHVESRIFDEGGISMHCYQIKQNHWCKKISSLNLISLVHYMKETNAIRDFPNISNCSLILTEDTSNKILGFIIDSNGWNISNIFHKIFSTVTSRPNHTERPVRSINDVIKDSVSDYVVTVEKEEEYFDDKFATFFLKLIFEKNENRDRIILDLNETVNNISKNLKILKLKLNNLYLYDTDGPWTEMRLCVNVEKPSTPINMKYTFSPLNQITHDDRHLRKEQLYDSSGDEDENKNGEECGTSAKRDGNIETRKKSRFNMLHILFAMPVFFFVTFRISNFLSESVSHIFF